jgi:virginiamycin B lyase
MKGFTEKETDMRSPSKLLVLMSLVVLLSSLCYGATITGTVKTPDGAPFEGALAQAQNTKTRIATVVLSDSQGHYRIERLPAGEYRVEIRAVGYRSDSHTGVNLTAEQSTSFDTALQKGQVHWSDLSIYQAGKLWPASKAKDKIFSTCFTCHGFQTRMASVTRDQDGWRDRVQFMLEAMRFGLADRINDQEGVEVADYLTSLYGPDSVLPKSPADLPEYKETLRGLSGGSPNNIVFVEYDMPGPSRMPFDANPAKDGSIWIPDFGLANKITKLDPLTGAMQDFPVPNVGTAAVHSAVPAPDGSVWLTEQGSNKLGRWDPTTQKITEYQDAYIPGKLGYTAGSKHTLRLDPAGNVWASGNPLTRFDPETQKFTRFSEVPSCYDVKPDKDGNIWFTKQDTHQIGRVDWKTLKVSIWTPPTKSSFPRRIEIDSDGIVWFGEFNSGKMGRFDPKTETFKEYDLPGPQPTPYGLGIDASHNIWYSSYFMDVLGRLDSKTGKVTEYPFPHSENSIREIIRDSQGRMWYGTPSNNKVGYFYLTGGTDQIEHASK